MYVPRLRKFLVEPKIQLHITLYLLSFLLIGIVSIYWNLRSSLNTTLDVITATVPKCSAVADTTFEVLRQALDRNLLINGIIVFSCGIFGGIVLSNRIVGPIFRLRKVLKEMGTDEDALSKLKFRDNDYFKDLAPLLQKLVKKK
ncbi:hypothetical protein K2X30_12295 [bacterium]|jgi:hypothetical protein|nr:hypothetical protein [bacterium]